MGKYNDNRIIYFDWAAQRLLRNKANFGILDGFLTVLLNKKITIIEILELVQKAPEEIFPEYFLIRVNEFNKVAVTPLEEWVAYLKDGIIRPGTSAPGLEEVRQKLQYYSMSAEERHAYDEHINAIMIQNDVISTAQLEGREEERKKNARKMKLKGFPAETIAEITKLSLIEIEKL